MKLRIRGDSLRLRLGQGEVRRLMCDFSVVEETAFAPGSVLAYRVELCEGPSGATLGSGGVVVRVARADAERWAASDDEVSIGFAQPAGDGRTLRVLVEKDFACLDAASAEPQDDAFPNPLASSRSC